MQKIEGSFREQLCEEAVAKWIDGPESIEEFCDWLILATLDRYEKELEATGATVKSGA